MDSGNGERAVGLLSWRRAASEALSVSNGFRDVPPGTPLDTLYELTSPLPALHSADPPSPTRKKENIRKSTDQGLGGFRFRETAESIVALNRSNHDGSVVSPTPYNTHGHGHNTQGVVHVSTDDHHDHDSEVEKQLEKLQVASVSSLVEDITLGECTL